MRNGRTGQLFPGLHEKLLTAAQFEQIKAIKSGRHVKKVSKHNHMLRRLFFCAACDAVLTPERQKSYVYYRCHTVGCLIKTVREEILDAAIISALKMATLSDDTQIEIDQKYAKWNQHQGCPDELQAINLRVSQAETRLDKLTDLLIDEKIDQTTHDRKRAATQIEIERLKEEQAKVGDMAADEEDRQKFLELMKTLAPLYETAEPAEKRVLVENCFSNRTWDGKCVCLEPSELIQWAKSGNTVPYGGEFKDTIRNFINDLDAFRIDGFGNQIVDP